MEKTKLVQETFIFWFSNVQDGRRSPWKYAKLDFQQLNSNQCAYNCTEYTIYIMKNKVNACIISGTIAHITISAYLVASENKSLFGLPLFLKYRMELTRITRKMLWHFNIKCWWCVTHISFVTPKFIWLDNKQWAMKIDHKGKILSKLVLGDIWGSASSTVNENGDLNSILIIFFQD